MTQGTVRGVVRRRDGGPVAGARVTAVEPRLRSRRQLGEPAVTDAAGRYEIHYPVEASGVDISIGVGDLWSRVRFRAAVHEVIDLVLDAEAESAPEFERVMAAVSPMLDGARLPDVDDGLTLLAGKAGQPIDRVS